MVVLIKGYIGYLFGVVGVIEVVFVLHAVRTGRVPEALGSAPLDPEVRVLVPLDAAAALARPIRRVLSNSFAFGGSNVCLAIGVPGTR